MSKEELQAEQDKQVKDFNAALAFMIRCVVDKNKKDEDIKDINDKFLAVKRENPSIVVIHGGPRVWKYREEIKKGEINFFLDNNFEDDVEEVQKEVQDEIPEAADTKKVMEIMTKIKLSWHRFNKEEQEEIMKRAKKLVKTYAAYLATDKQLQKFS